jgi:hypothetical protein
MNCSCVQRERRESWYRGAFRASCASAHNNELVGIDGCCMSGAKAFGDDYCSWRNSFAINIAIPSR